MFDVHGHLVVVAAGRRRTPKKHLEAAGRRAKAPGGQVHVGWSGGVRGTGAPQKFYLESLQRWLLLVPLRARGAPGVDFT